MAFIIISEANSIPVVFKLRGRLAKVYRLYEREKFSEQDKKLKEVTVTSYSDDIDSLLMRILKYGENCEVLYPKQVRNKMANLIKLSLENYNKQRELLNS